MGNYKDHRLETLSNKGNGNYVYVDHFSEARKNLAEQAADWAPTTTATAGKFST